MNQSLQSIPSRRRKCCRCNGVNARCKFCACAKANRACTDCLPSKHRCCQNAPTSITASNIVSTDSVSSSQPPYQHTSLFPDSQQLPLSQPLPQLPPTSLYLQLQGTLIVEPSLHLIQLYLYHIRWRNHHFLLHLHVHHPSLFSCPAVA